MKLPQDEVQAYIDKVLPAEEEEEEAESEEDSEETEE